MANVLNSDSRIWLRAATGMVALALSVLAPTFGDDEPDADSQPSRSDLTALDQITGAPPPTPSEAPTDVLTPEMRATIELARVKIEDGALQSAADALTEAAATPDGDRAEVHYLLATAKSRLGRFTEALASAERAVALAPEDADSHYLLARLYRGEGRAEDAIAHYRTVTLAAERELNNPNVTRAWYSLGQLLEMQQRPLAAAQAYAGFDEALWRTHPEQRNAPEMAALLHALPYGLTQKRLELLRSIEKYDDALTVVEWARSIWSEALLLDREYARALLDAGRPEQAFDFCRTQVENPAKTQVLLPVAIEAAAQANRLSEWLDALVRRVLDADQDAPRRQLLKALEQTGDWEQIVRVGGLLFEKSPGDEAIAWTLAAAQQKTGRLREALATLVVFSRHRPELAEIAPDRLTLWTSWFEDYANIGKLVRELRGADADFATDFVLGVSALAAAEPTLADELLQACVEARPDFAPAYVVRGEIMLAECQWKAALNFAGEILDRHPDLPAALFLSARAYEGLDQNEQAEQTYKLALKANPKEPAYALALAQHYRRLGELRGAQRYFQETLAASPGDGAALEGLIDCYLRGGKIEIARTALEQLDRDDFSPDSLRRIDTLMRHLDAPFGPEHLADLREQCEQYPDDIASARLLAGGLYFRGDLEQTNEITRKALAKHPGDYHLTILSANIYSLRGEFEQACEALNTQYERYPNRLAVLQPLALARLNAFQLEEGRTIIRRLMVLDPEEIVAYRAQFLRSYVEFGEFDEAIAAIDEWIEQNPEDDNLVRQKIALLIDCGYNDRAFEMARLRVQDDPTEQNQFDFLAFGMASEHYDDAADALREILKNEPANAEMTEKLIDVLLLADKPDEALETAQKFEGTYLESLTRRIWLGRCQAAKGAADTAVAEYEALLGERGVNDEQRRTVRFLLITTLIDTERYDEGLTRCEQWLSQAEESNPLLKLEALQYKRYLLQSAGREQEYMATMETLLMLNPEDVGLMNDLSYSWVDAGINVEQAMRMLKQVTAAEPWNAAYLDSLGWAYYKAGDFSNARKYLSRAVRLRAGRDPIVYDHLADAACRLDDLAAAREYWQKAVSLIEATPPDQTPDMDTVTAVRVKLAALQQGARPETAPTAAEQNEN